MNNTEPQYAGYQIIRQAHGGDKGFNHDPDAGEQVVIKGGGGDERVVPRSEVGDIALRGWPHLNDPQSTNNMSAGSGAPGVSPRFPGDDEDAVSKSDPRGGTTVGSISGNFDDKPPRQQIPRLRPTKRERDRERAEARS